MAQDVLDRTGRSCSVCGVEFNAKSMTLSIRTREDNMIVRQICCAECYEKHYSRGE